MAGNLSELFQYLPEEQKRAVLDHVNEHLDIMFNNNKTSSFSRMFIMEFYFKYIKLLLSRIEGEINVLDIIDIIKNEIPQVIGFYSGSFISDLLSRAIYEEYNSMNKLALCVGQEFCIKDNEFPEGSIILLYSINENNKTCIVIPPKASESEPMIFTDLRTADLDV